MPPPIHKHPDNRHYFLYRGRPTVLITSAEHYGSVINLDFDYRPYLDVLARWGMNATRIYAGAYLEPEHYFIHDNVLGPPVGRHILPWGRSDQPGYPLGGSRFDLDAWNPDYFARLRDFVDQAGRREIVVEVCLFNAMYPDTWALMPLNPANNIQGIGPADCRDFQTLKDERLAAAQEAYIRKIASELRDFDNVILEICDEPGIHGTTPEQYQPWIERLAGALRAEGTGHLVAQQICGHLGGPGDVTGDPRIDVLVGQYVGPTSGLQIGGMQLLDSELAHGKPIELNETAYYPIWYTGDIAAASRVEAWEFMVGGGASFNQLNGLYSTYNPAAQGTENETLLLALRSLKNFLHSFQFLRMQPGLRWVAGGLGEGLFARGLAEPGRQYALYLHHSVNQDLKYEVRPGTYTETLTLDLPAGDYTLEWVRPADGTVTAGEALHHPGGAVAVTTPIHEVDVAMRLRGRG